MQSSCEHKVPLKVSPDSEAEDEEEDDKEKLTNSLFFLLAAAALQLK